MHKLPKTVFFDLDETLISNQSDFEGLLWEVYAAQLGEPEPDTFRHFQTAIAKNASTSWERMFESGCGYQLVVDSFRSALSVTPQASQTADCANDMAMHFLEAASAATQLADNAVQVLERIQRAGIATGLITNGFNRLQRAKIDRHDLHEYLDTIVISEQAGAHKPSRKIFEYALQRVGAPANDAWHVGDHLVNDVQGANSAGLTTVLVQPDPALAEGENQAATSAFNHRISQLADILPLLGV